ncbi:hypothetical protein ACFXOD_25575 [Streptomyces sp. NPDC059161]|uniref:hypothetical protein n=1 Tax=Streptomyces sp. NPDC059161 TaxID=3346749 RepID=UPI0036A3A367
MTTTSRSQSRRAAALQVTPAADLSLDARAALGDLLDIFAWRRGARCIGQVGRAALLETMDGRAL